MKYEDKKIVGIIATNVEPAVALNVIGHLAISIGNMQIAKLWENLLSQINQG